MEKKTLREFLDNLDPDKYYRESKTGYRSYVFSDDQLDQEIIIPDPPKEFKPAEGPYIVRGCITGGFIVVRDGSFERIAIDIPNKDTARLLAASWEMYEFLKKVIQHGYHKNALENFREKYGYLGVYDCLVAKEMIERIEGRGEGKE
ncbi:MAG: hypothetical protein GWN93_26930 [Deltaproteobacteria bacterium]|nr:hypothetical protein [Deltaproteobacteria bacterium]